MNANSFNLNALVKFLGRDDWALQFEEVMGDHFWPVMDEFGLDHEEIFELLGSHWAMTLWGCAFEDFLTQAFEPDGRTFVDIYLKSRGFKETARSKAYLKAISASVISLYEVSEIVPGKSFLARDLLRGVDPVTVSEGTATQTLRQWEKIAARIVHVGGTNVITGGLLPYSPEATEALFEGLKEMTGKKRPRKTLILDDDTLRLAAPLFTHAWLFDTLPRVLGEVQPLVCNSDGDDIVFHEVRFPLETGIIDKDIADRFAGMDDLRQENPLFWNWLGRPPAKGDGRPSHPDALVAGVTMEDGTPVLGNLEIKGRFLVLWSTLPSGRKEVSNSCKIFSAKWYVRRSPVSRPSNRPEKPTLVAGHPPAIFRSMSQRRSFTPCSTNSTAPHSTNPSACSATSPRAPPPGPRPVAKMSPNGSNISKCDHRPGLTPTTPWPPTISHGYGTNSASRTSDDSLLKRL
jgi:hypothetical protein